MVYSIYHQYHQPIKIYINVLVIIVSIGVMTYWPQILPEDVLILTGSGVSLLVSVLALSLLYHKNKYFSTVLTLLSLSLMPLSIVLLSGGIDSLFLFVFPSFVLLAAILLPLKETLVFSVILASTTVVGIVLNQREVFEQPILFVVLEIWCAAVGCMLFINILDRQHIEQTHNLMEQIETNKKLQWFLECEEHYTEHLFQTLSGNIRREQSIFGDFLTQLQSQNGHPLERPIQILHDQMRQLANYVDTESSVRVVNRPTSMAEVYQSLNDIFGHIGQEYPIHIFMNIEHEEDDQINVDLARLEQVWINLFNNAVRFTKQGTIRIDLLREENQYRFQFFDTGCGIPQIEQEKIFSLFEQGKANVNAEGLGIGLALASNILNQFNSRLYLKSVEGKGALFWFFIDVVCEGERSP